MKNAFLVSDEDLRSLRVEPWFIELNGPAVFLHESVLRLVQQANQPKLMPNVNGPLDSKGRSLLCDQEGCHRTSGEPFPTFGARQTHRALTHRIPGTYHEKHKPKRLTETSKLPPPNTTTPPIPLRPDIASLVRLHKPASYQYMEFDAKGICGVNGCDFKRDDVKALHFHRSMAHKIRGINWSRSSHKARRNKKRKVAR